VAILEDMNRLYAIPGESITDATKDVTVSV